MDFGNLGQLGPVATVRFIFEINAVPVTRESITTLANMKRTGESTGRLRTSGTFDGIRGKCGR